MTYMNKTRKLQEKELPKENMQIKWQSAMKSDIMEG